MKQLFFIVVISVESEAVLPEGEIAAYTAHALINNFTSMYEVDAKEHRFGIYFKDRNGFNDIAAISLGDTAEAVFDTDDFDDIPISGDEVITLHTPKIEKIAMKLFKVFGNR